MAKKQMRIPSNPTVRQRIALWCIGLSTLVYIIPTLFGFVFFYYSLTAALDHELRNMESALGHAVDFKSGVPRFREWARVLQTTPARSMTTIQLFDASEHLLEHYGPPGVSRLVRNSHEVEDASGKLRVEMTPLLDPQGKTVGYLQFQIPTRDRDAAVKQFALVMALIAPIVLIGLGICSYFVSDKATIPIQQTIDLLRQFISDAGHELNTPLSIINACAESLEHKLAKQGIEAKEITTIASSSERMQSIIDDLMLLAALETALHNESHTDRIAASELINESMDEFSIKFEQKNIALTSHIETDAVIHGDEFRLRTMLNNLLENALRYTDAGGKVDVAATLQNNGLRIVVSDTGIGIPAENLPFIFDRFYRVDKSRSRSSGGSGLGLAIVKAIAEAHRGSIEVTSSRPGTMFTVILPAES
jgi:signal transduction histidine kinase